ncbi:hypothetical protein PR202_ga13956 [Eleusine coracana subsp. coracana]|uniref:Uncharacterized protein n=1 Tax=Eleusine coracana subsp. coracana TaxID=191504 RepID=A0AAV5CFD5_ELECO|nr:hypothetical protein QOZ80_3AG0210690 [Eleusine coracana subsp. coracana]GJM97058.1 hypothetical protein PR202_ga13956 [Eleusine coracana subsp. coracana]
MGKKKRREDEIAEEAQKNVAGRRRKRKRRRRTKTRAIGATSSSCDDVIRNIFARLPARTVVASMALPKHHRRLMCCPDFRNLHCRLGPPLPRPHIAYIATAKLTRRSGEDPVSAFHGFHVAGAARLDSAAAPMRSLAGPDYHNRRYVNTCNGVVLLSGEQKPNTFVLMWNPAVFDEEEEVTVPVLERDDCVILGHPKELLVYELGESPELRTVLSDGLTGEISKKSLYIDGVIYLLHVDNSVILAFDVDDETVTTIHAPDGHKPNYMEMYDDHTDSDDDDVETVTTVDNLRRPMANLMELSSRPCVETRDDEDDNRALWLLTEDHRCDRRCVFWIHSRFDRDLRLCSVAGVWDCGGVLVIYLHHAAAGNHRLCFANKPSTGDTINRKLPRSITPEWSEYAFCWGYKPTLVSPGSIVPNKLSEYEKRRRECTTNIMEALRPVTEHDRRKGHKKTLNTVCFMEFLVRSIQKLPDNLQDVIGMPLFDSPDPLLEF